MIQIANINLDGLVCDTFVSVFNDIVNCNVSQAVLHGGRNSTKSQVISEAIITGCMVNKASAVALLRYGNKMKSVLVDTFSESINYMGVGNFWKLRMSPLEYVLLDSNGKETNVSIKFTGCDNQETLKSFKPRSGSFRYVWFEEVTNFSSKEQVDSIIQTMARGVGKHCVIFTYNPPKSATSWCNKEWNHTLGDADGIVKPRRLYKEEYTLMISGKEYKQVSLEHHSDYRDVVKCGHTDWLGIERVAEAERSKIENPEYYKWNWLGLIGNSSATVFPNVREWDSVLPKGSEYFRKSHYRGFDFGYGGPDRNAYVEWLYDDRNKYLYCIGDFGKPGMSLEDIAFEIKKNNTHLFPVKSDSANPLLVSELNNKLPTHCMVMVKKPKDSVRAGVMWLQSLNGIFIDKLATPNVYKEFKEYEYVIDRDNQITSALPDKNNHSIDATRYAMYDRIKFDV